MYLCVIYIYIYMYVYKTQVIGLKANGRLVRQLLPTVHLYTVFKCNNRLVSFPSDWPSGSRKSRGRAVVGITSKETRERERENARRIVRTTFNSDFGEQKDRRVAKANILANIVILRIFTYIYIFKT